jgi:L-ribulokinase
LLKWWVEGICGPATSLGGSGVEDLHAQLSADAAKLAPGESGLVALDWNNGNRTILVDARLTGLILGQTLHTTRAEIYRALIEATAFGARAIVERLREYGVPIDRVVCCGGIAEKNPLFMQIYADVIGQPMLIAGSPQTPALGSAVSAAVTAGAAAGGYDTWTDAQDRMTSLKERRFEPDRAASRTYDALYGIYRELHDAFGGVAGARPDLASVMKRLLAIKERARHVDA